MRRPIDDDADDRAPSQAGPQREGGARGELAGLLSSHAVAASPDLQIATLAPASDAVSPTPGAKGGGSDDCASPSDGDAPWAGEEKRLVGDDAKPEAAEGEGVVDDDSPYELVRHSVSNRDDPSMYSLTFRVWVLGAVFTGVLSFVNQFFFYRQNQLSLGGSVVQLLAFPAGYVMSRVLPSRRFTTFGWTWSLNPGPFNIKEHVLISIFATASSGSPYAIDVVTIKKIWYQSDLGFVASLLFILTSQIMGYSFAGLTRRFLVYPAAMIWPSTLISVTLFRTFHEVQSFGSRMSRTRMFWMCFVGSFVWYFVPNFLVPALSYIAILCYIAPNNVIANQMGDSYNGLGILNFTLD
ncbi:hypothetical protein H4R21_003102, partial [Coemansia helicoidea]